MKIDATPTLSDDEIMAKYCTPIEAQLRQAGSRAEAAQILQTACTLFEQECNSEIIMRFLKRFADDTFNKYWGIK